MPNTVGKLKWDQVGEKLFETGLDNVVLYVQESNGTYPKGVAWNGATSVSESPSGAEPNKHYANNSEYINLLSREEFSATLEAFTYPDEFAACDGTASPQVGLYIRQQARVGFGLAYRTKIGDDIVNEDLGYKLHLIYGGKAAPSERAFTTIGETPEPVTFSWEISTTPVAVPGLRPASVLEIDSTKVSAEAMKTLEDILYGKDPVTDEEGEVTTPGVAARLPLPAEIIQIISAETAG